MTASRPTVDKSAFLALAAAGKTYQEIADTLGLAYGSVAGYAWRNGIAVRVPCKERVNGAYAALAAEGLSVSEMSQRLGVGRKTIWRWAYKNGVTLSGGRAAKAAKKPRMKLTDAEKVERRNAACIARFGLPPDVMESHRAKGYPKAYAGQKRGARGRGIKWEFTFASWIAVWEESGKFAQRGRGADKYVMARFGDVGPYSPTNVYICTNSQNLIDAKSNHVSAFRLSHAGRGRGWYLRKNCPHRPYAVTFRGAFIGGFATPEEAEAAYERVAQEYRAQIAAGAFDREPSVHAQHGSLFLA